MRQQAARSFGSCSFEEPIAELRQWLWESFLQALHMSERDAQSRRLELGAIRERARHRLSAAEPAVRRVRPARDDDPPRIGVAIGDQILDVAACHARGLFDGPGRGGRRCVRGGDAERADGARAAGLVGAAGAAQRAAACVSSRSAAPARAGRAVSRADGGGDDAAAGGDRRLHRFLRVDPSRDQRRIDDAARQSAAAELQVRADRLSRPRVVDRRERHADPPAARAGEARRGAAGLSRVGAARLRGGGGLVRRAGQRARRRHPDRSRRTITSSACVW